MLGAVLRNMDQAHVSVSSGSLQELPRREHSALPPPAPDADNVTPPGVHRAPPEMLFSKNDSNEQPRLISSSLSLRNIY